MWFDNFINEKGEIYLTVDKAIDILLTGGQCNNFVVEKCNDINKHNKNSKNPILSNYKIVSWLLPNNYLDINIDNFFNQFKLSEIQQKRVLEELQLYKKNNLYIVLKLMIYLVDIMNKSNIVWGVGRGSSVSSYLLYLIGVHKVDSIKYNLDIKEFIK